MKNHNTLADHIILWFLGIIFGGLLTAFVLPAFGQVQIDNSIELTGQGLNARVMGIDTAILPNDAVPLKMLSNSPIDYFNSANSGFCVYDVNIPSHTGALPEGMNFLFKAEQHCSQSSNYTPYLIVNGIGKELRWYTGVYAQDMLQIAAGRIYMVVFDGVYWQLIGTDYNY